MPPFFQKSLPIQLARNPTMAIASRSVLLIVALFVSSVLSDVSTTVGDVEQPVLGGWKPIKDLKAPEVQKASKFAVAQHNKQSNDNLKFESVVRGEEQVVAGSNYRLVIAAKGITGEVGQYEAVVWVKPWEHFMNLTSFKKL